MSTLEAKTIQKYALYIGIDPGTNTGFAVYDKNLKDFTQVSTMPIHQALELAKSLHNTFKIFVRVEDARLAVHGRRTEKDTHKLQGAGSIKRDASIWEDFLKDNNIPHQMVRPNKQITKLTSEKFKQVTRYVGRTSNHSRDAGMLVYGF